MSLIDRRILIEKEIDKLHKECAAMYRQITLFNQQELQGTYDARMNTLAEMRTDLQNVMRSIEENE